MDSHPNLGKGPADGIRTSVDASIADGGGSSGGGGVPPSATVAGAAAAIALAAKQDQQNPPPQQQQPPQQQPQQQRQQQQQQTQQLQRQQQEAAAGAAAAAGSAVGGDEARLADGMAGLSVEGLGGSSAVAGGNNLGAGAASGAPGALQLVMLQQDNENLVAKVSALEQSLQQLLNNQGGARVRTWSARMLLMAREPRWRSVRVLVQLLLLGRTLIASVASQKRNSRVPLLLGVRDV
ncbi:unnamed protein product [Ectocarpus sp. CCAP 1310/34]|nr:unnamed protein product [Ectocarpus sp. CCAP 1310/34]